MDSVGEGLSRLAVLGTATYLWCHGYQNGWVIFMFMLGLL